MLDAKYYHIVYLIVVMILTLLVSYRYAYLKSEDEIPQPKHRNWGPFLFFVLVALFIGFRPIDGLYFVDMTNYFTDWYTFGDPNYKITWETNNKVFDNLMYLMAGKGWNIRVFFVLVAFIYFGGIYYSCKMLFSQDKMMAFLVYLAAFSTFSYGVNGIKAGAAASLFLVALAFDNREKKLWTIIFLLLSWGFHHSMILPVLAFLGCKVIRRPVWFFIFWGFCFFLALFHVTFFQNLFATLADDVGAGYLAGGDETIRRDILNGFRLDFIIYGAVPILIGWIAVYKKKIDSSKYLFLLNLYTFTNAIWMLCMYAEFTNRIAYLSWFMYPIVLIYPLLREEWGEKRYGILRWISYGHLAFTLFMMFIYY